ncbi:alpha-ribazole phosphatase family protein [Pararhodobacter oceanensis]|uniref:alpha-ribazole phosphatase family protein n=1 Tax=Pararhodobacter oceanensis TaxID=2172121 RepID=UPI003A8FEA07
MSLILLRHTRPEGADGICYGRSDLPLAEGFEVEVARLLAELPQVVRIVTSPLSRCRLLAEAIGARRNQRIESDPRLLEMDFGEWENRSWSDIPRAQIDAWMQDFDHAKPHGGESVFDLAQRTHAAFDALSRGAVPVLAVTHSGVIRSALAGLGDPQGWHVNTDFGNWRQVDWPARAV